MKRIRYIQLSIFLLAIPLIAHSQLNKAQLPPDLSPDPATMPYVLDSTAYFVLNRETGEWRIKQSEHYIYDSRGNLVSDERQFFIKSPFGAQPSYIRLIYNASGQVSNKTTYYGSERMSDLRGIDSLVYSYDANANLIMEIHFEWDEDRNIWVRSERLDYSYNAEGYLSRELHFKWNEFRNKWKEEERLEFSYNADGQLVEKSICRLYLPVFDLCLSMEKEAWTYNPDGSLSEYAVYYWVSDWNLRHRTRYSYDDFGNLKLSESLDFGKDATPASGHKRVCSYNAEGKLLVQIDSSYTGDWNYWVEDGKEVRSYDDKGMMTEIGRYTNDRLQSKQAYYYDALGNLASLRYQYYEQDKLSSYDLETWLYDENGYLLEYFDYEDRWVFSSYAEDGRLTERTSYRPKEDVDYWNKDDLHCEGDACYYNGDINDWLAREKYVAYWSELATSVPSSSEDKPICIYPNPFQDLITIKSKFTGPHSVQIFSMNGQQVLGGSVEGPVSQLDLGSLSNGIYLITIRSSESVIVQKIFKH